MSGSYSMDPTFRISNCELGRRSPVVTRSMGNTSKNDILAKVFCLSPKEILRPNYFESELSEDEQIQERKGRRQKLVKRRRSVSAICRHKKEPIKSTDINDYKNPLNTPKKLLERRYTLDAVLSDHKELCFSNGMGNFHLYNTNYADFPIKNNQIIPLQTQDEVIEMRCALSGSNRENIKDKLDIDTNQTNSHRSRARKRKPDKVKIINNALSPKVNQHSQSNKIEIITTKQEISRTTNKEDSSESSTKRNSDRVKDIINNSKSRNSIQTKIDNEDTGIVPKSSLKCSLKLECMENLSKRRRSKTPNKYCCDTNKNDRRKVPQSTGRRKSLIETNKKIDIEQIYIDQVQKSIDMSEAGPKTPNKLKPNKVIDTTNTLNSEMKSSRSNLLLKSKVDIVKEKLNKSKEHSNPSKEHSNPRKEHSSPRKEHSNPRDVDYVKCKIENKQGLDRIDKKPSECGRKNKKEKVKKTPMALKEESGHTYNVSKPTEKLRSPGLNKGVVEEKLKESNSMKDVSKNNRADCRSKHHHQSRSEHKDYMATPTKRDREQTKSFKNHSEERVVPKDNKHASREKENERKDKNKNTKHSDHSNSRKEDEHKRSERTKHRSSSTSKSRDVMKNIGEVQSELKDTNKNVEKNEVERSYNKRGNEENMNKNKNAINKEISDSMKPNSSTPDIIKIKEKSVSDRTRYKCSENPNKKIEVESKRTMDMATDTTDYLPELIPINNVEFAFTNNTNNSTSQSLPTLKYKQGVNNQGDIQIKVITPYTESLRNLPHDLKISLTPRYPNANQHQPEPMSKIVQTSVKYPGTNQIVRTEKPAEYPPMPHTVADQIGNALKPRRHSYSADMNIQPHLPQHLESKSPQMKPLIEEPKQLPVCPLLNQSNRKPASNKQLTYLDRDPRMIAKVRRSSKPAPEEAAQENIMRGVSTSQNLADVPVAAPQKDAPSIRNTFTVNEWEFARKFCENIQNYMERTPEELLASMFETSNLDNDSTEDLIQILADNAPVETLTDAIPSVVAGETSAVDDNCKTPIGTEPSAMEHYKKRLIHQMQSSKSHPTTSVSEADSGRLYFSPTATCKSIRVSPNEQEATKKEPVQSKATKRRSVCRSKYRHNSLELFKLGNSTPTSLCKSQESYTVSAEKNLQMCQQQNGQKYDVKMTSPSITDEIIQTIDIIRKKDPLQRSTSGQSDKTTDSSSDSIETPKVSGRHQLPPIISDIPERSQRRRSSTKTNPPVEPKLNGQRRNSTEESPLPDLAPRKKIASRRQNVINTENNNCERTTTFTSQDSPINLSVKKKDTESLPRPTPSYPNTVCVSAQNSTFPQIEQQINRLKTTNECRVEDFRNSITMSIIQLVRSVMEEDNLNAQVVLILNEWFSELRRVLYTATTSQQTRVKVIEVLNEVVDFLWRHIFGSTYPSKYKALVEEFIQLKLQAHADLLREKLSLLSKTADRYQWMLQLMKTLKEYTFGNSLVVDKNIRRASTGGNDQMNKMVNGNALPSQLPTAHKSQKTPKKIVEIRRNGTYRRSVNIPPVMGVEYIGLVPTNVEPPAVVHPRNTEVWFDVRVPRGNTVLEQTVEVRDTSMEVTKDTNNASASNTVAINDDVFLEEVDEREDSKVDVKDFKFDLAEFQQKYMPTTSRTKLKQLIQIFREEDFQCYQKVMEKLSAATELPVKEIITIDDEDGATSGEGNSVPEPDNAATIISAKRAVSVGANVSPSKKLKVNTVTTSTNTQTNPNQDKDLNQNYIPGERSVIVQQKNNESHTAPPPPPAPCVIEDISSEEDTTSRTFSELSEPPQQPDAYMNVNKSTGNIIYAKAMPSQPPPPMPSCSQTPPHLPFYKPRANEKPTTVLDNVVTEPFPTTPEMLSPTSPIAHTPLSAVTPAKPDVSWRSWMSDERYKNFFGMNMSPTSRDQSLETINSIGSNYSPKFILDNNMVDVKLDTKWFRITKRLYDRIPKGKMCYIKDTNTFVRYFDDAQTQKFITNLDMYVNNPLTTDLLKQIKGRKQNNAGLDTYVGPLESSINNEVFHVAKNVTFCPNDKINDPEMYVHEVQKVQKYLPIDFYAFYKFVTGYQIINNHAPISFQTFLIMHNTNGMRKLFNKYVRSLIEGWIVV